ncbi:uncharacterized protein LOC121422111 [Lytechinus variegatus]|uniref:uncharacterized protein LOC121422111 n=1 Tax=Lytechinus variegatus TaxID=7654 RepID=UPI001BB1B32D|nr:uncharacterized protein LOC121422111 [Lytechinus variegatus]
MAISYFLISLLGCFLCVATTSPINQDEATTAENLAELSKDFHELVSVLRQIIPGLHQSQEPASETIGNGSTEELRDYLVNHFKVRNRRSSDTALSALSGPFTNESDAVTGVSELNRILLSYHSLTPAGGTIYTHWGRDDCPNGSELVYSGSTAGAYYSHTGGGVNYLCLPKEPIYSEVERTAHASRSLLYNAEYETSTAQVLQDLHDQTPACAICRAPPTRLTKIMIPGRNVCPSSKWRLEYKGYLMSSLYSHKTRTDFVCMDEDAMGIPGTTGSQDGALFYMVEARCSPGGIQCGPYVNGYELTCAVCTI